MTKEQLQEFFKSSGENEQKTGNEDEEKCPLTEDELDLLHRFLKYAKSFGTSIKSGAGTIDLYLENEDFGDIKMEYLKIERNIEYFVKRFRDSWDLIDKFDIKNNETEQEKFEKKCEHLDTKIMFHDKHYLSFTLPKFKTKRSDTYATNAKYIKDLTKKISELIYEINKEISLPFARASIVFEHHTKSKLGITDADNLDAKSATDALKPLVLLGDNLDVLTVTHISVYDENEYTLVHVMDKKHFPKWVEKHSDIWK